ncbi:Hydroxylase [Gammaproteobacteria bacterium]
MPVAASTPEGQNLCDILVIGGGPAGSTVAALLAEKGHRVTLLEKARHPRFHIGESLLPANLPLFEKLGIRSAIEAIGMPKWGAEFVSPWHSHRQRFEFAEAWDKAMPYAFQVRRSEFDEILIRNAARRGAEVIEGCQVQKVEFPAQDQGAIIQALDEAGVIHHWQTRFVIDASGRQTFLGHHFKAKRRNERHNSASIYGHFAGARRHPGKEEGHISIFWFEHGWFWFIPLADGATSVGVVAWPYYMQTRPQSKSLAEFFLDTIATCPALAERLTEARLLTEVEATGNFSYVCDRTHGSNYLLLGDAYAFIDPVFSSGVMLAMQSAFVGADTVDICLRQPEAAPAALQHFDQMMKQGPRVFSWFIYRVTNPALRDLFMAPRNALRMKEAILSVLAGDIFGQTPIWRSLLAFKAVYYLTSLLHPRRTFLAWQRRRLNIRALESFEGHPTS